jgi:AcrR family transcriptional regulator
MQMIKKKSLNTKNTPIRERILETATKLFYEHGIQSVGVDKIVAEARIAKMTLYNYFSSKDELIVEYLENVAGLWFEDFHKYLNTYSKNDEDRLRKTFDFLRRQFDDEQNFRGCAYINATTELADKNHPAHKVTLEFQERLRESFENWAFNSGLNEARVLSYSIINLFNGAIVSAMVEDFPEPIKHASATVARLIEFHRD